MSRIDAKRGRRSGSRDGDGAARSGRRTRALALGGSATAWVLALAFVTVGTVRALPRVASAAPRGLGPAAAVHAHMPAAAAPERAAGAGPVVTPAGPARGGAVAVPVRAGAPRPLR